MFNKVEAEMKYLALALLGIIIVLSCDSDKKKREYVLSEKSQEKVKSHILFSQGNDCYFYDIKLMDSFCLFLDNKKEITLKGYQIKENFEQVFTFPSEQDSSILIKPVFVKNTYQDKSDTCFVIDNGVYVRRLVIEEGRPEIYTLSMDRFMPTSLDYSLTSTFIYSSPLAAYKMYSFCYYSKDSGYYWMKTPLQIKNISPNKSLICTNSLCINEKKSTVVSAYRYANYLSFFDLYGNVKAIIQVGEEIATPVFSQEGEFSVEATTKYFIDTQSTSKYVYCLFSGSSDFSVNSKIFIFKWNGTHLKTIELDRHIRKFAVDRDNRFIIAIASTKGNGQDIIKYCL